MIVIFGIRVVGKGSWKDGEFISKFLCLVEDREVTVESLFQLKTFQRLHLSNYPFQLNVTLIFGWLF